MLKRIVDVVVSAAFLVAVAPLLLAVAVLIKLGSRGPVFFRQVRVGVRGREFRILKLRTMIAATIGGGRQLTVGADPRVTRVGRFLRKSKVDELPQLWNVFVGDMSLVGPRPEVPSYVAQYPVAIRDLILSVRPGITDLASIAFRNENELLSLSPDPERTYIEEILPAKLRYYEEYVRSNSICLDVKIIFLTAIAVCRGR